MLSTKKLHITGLSGCDTRQKASQHVKHYTIITTYHGRVKQQAPVQRLLCYGRTPTPNASTQDTRPHSQTGIIRVRVHALHASEIEAGRTCVRAPRHGAGNTKRSQLRLTQVLCLRKTSSGKCTSNELQTVENGREEKRDSKDSTSINWNLQSACR